MLTAPVALAVIVATLALFAWVGFRTPARAGEDLEEYVAARNSQRALPLGLSFFASGMGAWILFAPPEVGATVGVVAVVGYALGAAAPLVVFVLLGRRLRAVAPGGHGLTEFVRLRFGRTFHLYVVGVSLAYMLIFVMAELTALGALVGQVGGIDATVAIVALAAVTVAYTAYGGLRASLRTDSWQAWLVLLLLGVGVVVAVGRLADPGGALRASGRLGIDRIGIEAAITLVLAITAANLFHHGYWQRVFAARDRRSLAAGGLLGAGAVVPVVAVAGALGILAAGVGLAEVPSASLFALVTGLPAWVGAAVLALGIALVASSVDTLENGLGALIASERPGSGVGHARLLTVALLIPALLVAVQGYSVLRLFLIADLLCAATVVPALLGLTASATGRGALAGAAAGLAGAVLPGWVSSGSLQEGLWLASFPGAVPTLAPFAGALLASTAVALAVSAAADQRTDLREVGSRIPALSETPR